MTDTHHITASGLLVSHASPWDDFTPAERKAAVLEVMQTDRTRWWLAADVAADLGVGSARQHGNGAKSRRSWSGWMIPALRVAPTMRAMVKARMLHVYIDADRYYKQTYRVR